MPYLIDTESRTGALVDAINDVLWREGPTALSLRRIARASGVSPSSMLHHYGSREHLIRVAAGRTGRARVAGVRSRLYFEGVTASLPEHERELPDARAWLAWQELWRSEETLVSTISDARDDERALVSRTLQLPFESAALDAVVALVDGLLVAVCRPTRPLGLGRARAVLKDQAGRIGCDAAGSSSLDV